MLILHFWRTNRLTRLLIIAVVLLSALDKASTVTAKSFMGMQSPIWSPDGQHIAFLKTSPGNAEGGTNDLYIIHGDGSGAVKLLSGILYNPLWSPDGTHIIVERIFPTNGPEAASGLDKIDVASAADLTLTQDGYNASWSRNGKRIYFLRTDGKLYVMDADGFNLHAVPFGKMPTIATYAWSPDGQKLVFVNQPDPQNADKIVFYLVNADGSELHQIDTGSIPAIAWSPDSRQFVTISHCGGQEGLCLFNADGSSMRSLLKDSARISWSAELAWSPNGTSIASVYHGRITLASLDGSNPTILTHALTSNPNVSIVSLNWSPDSRRLVFQAQYVSIRVTGDPFVFSELYTLDSNDMSIRLLKGIETLP